MDLRLRRVLPVLAFVLLLPDSAAACPICFGAADSPLLDSARLGVLTMAALTVCVLATFGAWFVKLSKLEAEQSALEDQPIDNPAAVDGHPVTVKSSSAGDRQSAIRRHQ